MQYLILHTRVINNKDYHPIGRENRVYVFEKLIDACNYIDHSAAAIPLLVKDGIGVWPRRDKEDFYKMAEITNDYKYKLDGSPINKCSPESLTGQFRLKSIVSPGSQYMLLHIKINKKKQYPDNIQFFISFHQQINQAISFIKDEELNENKLDKLSKLKSIMLNNDFYQIIKLESGKEYCLNEYCPQIQPNVW